MSDSSNSLNTKTTNKDITEKVLKNLNCEFGSDVKNLSKCKELVSKFSGEKDLIEKKINKVCTDVSSSEITHSIIDVSNTIDEVTKDFSLLCKQVEEKEKSVNASFKNFQEQIEKIQELEQGLCYLRCVRSIQDISNNIEMYLTSRSEAEAVSEFTALCQMCARLQHSKCAHLTTYLSDTIHHWHNLLKDRFSAQLDEVLKAVGWPLVSSSVLTVPAPDATTKLQVLVKHLYHVQLPSQLVPLPAVTSSLLASFPPLSLPVTLLLKPLRKRFVYHFCGNRQTNRSDKPEWFMTQILTWIREHENFVNQWVQPVYNQYCKPHKSAMLELTQGLVQLVVDKLHGDLPGLMCDDALFSHTVDETLGFDRELKDLTSYPASLPSAVSVLTQAQVFVKWIHMERKYARDKMDQILSSESAWQELGTDDEQKVTEAADSFLTLLGTMTERYSILPQPGHKLQFVELQLELVDELRVRLLQLLHAERQDPLESRLPAILNTTSHIETALADWGATPRFLMLHHYKAKLDCAGVEGGVDAMRSASLKQGTVFDQTLTLLQHLVQELISVLCEAVMLEVKARSRPYRRDKWFAMSCESCLTPSACPMFQVLVSKLHTLESLLAHKLFTVAWQNIATQLCTFLLEELVLQNQFNEGGAKQLEQDLTRSLIPLFHQYTQKPEAYFLPLKEACTLLNVRPLPAEWERGQLDKLPLELRHLSPALISQVIQKRADVMFHLM